MRQHSPPRRAGRMRMKIAVALVAALAHHDLPRAEGMIHNLVIKEDGRRAFQIETFGFREGGFMNLTVSGFSVDGSPPYRAGLIVRKTESESSAQEHLEDILKDLDKDRRCLLDEASSEDLVLEFTPDAAGPGSAGAGQTGAKEKGGNGATRHASRTVGPGQKGLYVLMYVGCMGGGVAGMEDEADKITGQPDLAIDGSDVDGAGMGSVDRSGSVRTGRHLTSFKLKVVFWNQATSGVPDYLSAGSEPLPKLFFVMFLLFLGALAVWVQCMRRHPAQVHHIHHMMAVLLVFKTLSMLFESIRYHYLRLTGAAEAWSIVYYLFAFLKGITLFVVILLIGMGWSLIKPFLNGRDKRIIFVVLTLQVVNNVAQIVLEETAPGSMVWLKWRNLLHAMDLVCCCTILLPIVWSIRHLKQASLADGKADNTIRRLRVFTQFYQMVLLYVYFTRIVLVLLAAMLPFELSWVQTLCSEMATLIFFVLTGWRFRPQPDAAYLPLSKDGDQEGSAARRDHGAVGVELRDSRRDFPGQAV